jgi:hypothetical protein
VTLPSEDRERLLERLRRVDLQAFRGEVRAVLIAYGDVAAAASALRVAATTLEKWIDRDASLVAGVELEG